MTFSRYMIIVVAVMLLIVLGAFDRSYCQSCHVQVELNDYDDRGVTKTPLHNFIIESKDDFVAGPRGLFIDLHGKAKKTFVYTWDKIQSWTIQEITDEQKYALMDRKNIKSSLYVGNIYYNRSKVIIKNQGYRLDK